MISNTIESVSQFVCTSSGIALTSLGVASQTGSSVINDSTLLPLSLFIGGIAFTATLTWRASSAKANLAHKLDEIERRLKALENESGLTTGMETRIDMAESAIRDFKRRKRK